MSERSPASGPQTSNSQISESQTPVPQMLGSRTSESQPAHQTDRSHLHSYRKQPAGPPTPSQRRFGTRLAIGIIVAVLLAIILLDHYGILH